ncbi:MAG TPA: methyltransferase domain-containing protein [Methylomirabilota bacterium]|jgi:SAM-dependent methyltransferase|nr:methyltransferase domain-containing protein [Methylomirabilota bacterium]
MRILDFYDRHPISEAQVLDAVRRARGGTTEPLTADELFPYDQDHYGGLGAVDALARRAAITATSRVLDICAGLGGPARFLATRRGCRVVGVELHPGRAAGMRRLSQRVGLERAVVAVRGDATALPFATGRFDACLSQEALLHISDKGAVLAEARRVLRPSGRLAFSDWITHPGLGDLERARLEEWMAAVTLQSIAGYRTLLGQAGFRAVESEDLTDEWRGILKQRLIMYRALREDTVRRLGEARYQEYDALYAFFVGLVEAGKLGGGRFSATS